MNDADAQSAPSLEEHEIDRLEARLKAVPSDEDSFVALCKIRQRRKDLSALFELLDSPRRQHLAPMSQARVLVDTAELVYATAQDSFRAKELLHEAIEKKITPDLKKHIATRLAQLHGEADEHRGRVEALVHLVQAETELHAGEATLVSLALELTRAHRDSLDDDSSALAVLKEQLQNFPQNISLLYETRQLLTAMDRHQESSDLLEREAGLESDPERRIALIRELADVKEHVLKKPNEALHALEAAAERFPGDATLQSDIGHVLRRAAENKAPSLRRATLRRAADAFYRAARSAALGYQTDLLLNALDAEPTHEPSLMLLETAISKRNSTDRGAQHSANISLLKQRWLAFLETESSLQATVAIRLKLVDSLDFKVDSTEPVRLLQPILHTEPRAARRLQEIHRHNQNAQAWADAVLAEVPFLTGSQRMDRLQDALEEAHSQGRDDLVDRFASTIVDDHPSDSKAIAARTRVFREQGKWLPLMRMLENASKDPKTPATQRAAWLIESATIAISELTSPQQALEALRQAWALHKSTPLFHQLRDVLVESERWGELTDLLEEQSSMHPEDTDLLLDLSELADRRLHNLDRAAAALRLAKQRRPQDAVIRNRLIDLLRRKKSHLELPPLLEERLHGDPNHLDTLRELAGLYERHVKDLKVTRYYLDRVIKEDPDDMESFDRIRQLDTREKNWPGLADALRTVLTTRTGLARVNMKIELGTVLEQHLEDHAGAAAAYAEALDYDPHNAEAFDRLTRLLEGQGLHSRLQDRYLQRIEQSTNSEEQANLYAKVAHIRMSYDHDSQGAYQAWEEVLKRREDPDALRQLQHQATLQGDEKRRESLLMRLAAVTVDKDDRRTIHVEITRLMIKDPSRAEEALEHLKAVLRKVGPSAELWLVLGEVHAVLGQDAEEVTALERALQFPSSATTRLGVAKRLTTKLRSDPRQVKRAVDAARIWVTYDPEDLEGHRTLVALLEPTGRKKEWSQALDGLAQRSHDPEESMSATLRSANALHDLEEYKAAWTRYMELAPYRLPDTEQRLHKLTKKLDLGDELASAYVRLARHTQDEVMASHFWRLASDVYERILLNPDEAFEAKIREFAVKLDDLSCLDEVDSLALKAGATARLEQVYNRVLEQGAADFKAMIHTRFAKRMYQAKINKEAAFSHAMDACRLDPYQRESLNLARILADELGKGHDLLELYTNLSERTDAKTSVQLLLNGSELCFHQLNLPERGTRMFASALERSFSVKAIYKTVEEFAERLSLVDKLAEICDRLALVSATENPALAMRYSLRAATLWKQNKQAKKFYESLISALRHSPSQFSHTTELVEVAKSTQMVPDLLHTLDKLANDSLDKRLTIRLLEFSVEVSDLTDDNEVKVNALKRLLSLRGRDDKTLSQLENSMKKAERHHDRIDLLENWIQDRPPKEKRVELLRTIAHIWDQDLENPWEAIAAWKKLLEEDPHDEEAKEAVARSEFKPRLSTGKLLVADLPKTPPPKSNT